MFSLEKWAISPSGVLESKSICVLRSSTHSTQLLSRNMPILSVLCCCVTKHHKFSSLKERISLYFTDFVKWEPRHALVGSPVCLSFIKLQPLLVGARVSFESLTGEGSDSKLSQVVGRIQFLQSCWLRALVTHRWWLESWMQFLAMLALPIQSMHAEKANRESLLARWTL